MISFPIFVFLYCISKKWWPILFINLLYKMGHYFLDRRYEQGISNINKHFVSDISIQNHKSHVTL